MAQTPPLSYCGQEVRHYDRDRFLTALFAPAERREDIFALYAFNLEIAKIREIVSEPMMGHIRLQWWRDALAAIYTGEPPPKHQIVQPLAASIERHNLPAEAFEAVLQAREADLDDQAPADMGALLGYAGASSGALSRLAVQILGETSPQAHEAAQAAGMAWALTGLLRAVPFHARSNRLYLPADLLAREGVSADQIIAGKPPPELAKVVEEVSGRAWTEIQKARSLRLRNKRAIAAFLPVSIAQNYLKALRRAGYDAFDPRLAGLRPSTLGLAIRAALGRY